MSTGSTPALERPAARSFDAARRRTVRDVLTVVAFYSSAGWAYIALNAVVHPESLGWPLTHLMSWPHEDTFGIGCFVMSFGTAVASRLLGTRR